MRSDSIAFVNVFILRKLDPYYNTGSRNPKTVVGKTGYNGTILWEWWPSNCRSAPYNRYDAKLSISLIKKGYYKFYDTFVIGNKS